MKLSVTDKILFTGIIVSMSLAGFLIDTKFSVPLAIFGLSLGIILVLKELWFD